MSFPWSFRRALLPSALLLSSIACVDSQAPPCQAKAISVPIRDVQVYPDIPDSLMRGIPATVGTPSQNIVLAPWPDLNNTYIYDQQLYCDETIIFSDTICEVRRGHPFFETDSSSWSQSLDVAGAGGATQELAINGSEFGVSKLVDSSLGGTDLVTLGTLDSLPDFPIAIPRMAWDGGYTILHALGLGSNSTLLGHLKSRGIIGARIWSIFWGRMWTDDNPLDGSLVFGGYDSRKVLGTNHTQALDYSSTGCWTGMKLNLQDVIINHRAGGDESILPSSTVLQVCLVPQRQLLLEAPGAIYDSFETITETSSIGLSFGIHWGARLFDTGTQFDGDITFVLDSGVTVRVLNDQFVVPFVNIERNGSRVYNESQREVLISSLGNQPPTLGRYFLTSAYLMVDQDSSSFTIWQANPTDASELQALGTSGTNCSTAGSIIPTSSESPGQESTSSLSGGSIAGIVIGIVALLLLLVAAAFWFLRKRQRQKRQSRPSMAYNPANGSGFKHELNGDAPAWSKQAPAPIHEMG